MTSRMIDIPPPPGDLALVLPVRRRLPYPHDRDDVLAACEVPEHPLADGAEPPVQFSVTCPGCLIAFGAVVLRDPMMPLRPDLGMPWIKIAAITLFRDLVAADHPVRVGVERELRRRAEETP